MMLKEVNDKHSPRCSDFSHIRENQGKLSPGQEIAMEFGNMTGYFWKIDSCDGIAIEFFMMTV